MRKQADEARQVGKGPRPLHYSAVHVDGVAHALEGVEGNSDGKRDLQNRQGSGAEDLQQNVQILRGEYVVLEEGQQTEVAHDGRYQGSAPAGGARTRSGDDASADEIHDGGGHHQQHEPRLPPAVEDVTRNSEKCVPVPRQHVVDQQNQRQEVEEKDVSGENQASG